LPLVLVLAIGLIAFPHSTGAADSGADRVFARYQDQVVQIRVLDASSGSQSAVGSGFVVSAAGDVITNYHVVSPLIHKPDRYHAEIVHSDDYRSPLTLLDFDAIHDVALVRTDRPQPAYFHFRSEPVAKGTRVFSIGNPQDLGMTIVEGTHSGLMEQTLYESIHFTGSLNSGMSGGPAVTADGRVIGVNVATSGNQLSFLVPAKFARRMLSAQARAATGEQQQSWLNKLRDQLLDHQEIYLQKILDSEWPTASLGPYRVPGKIAAFVRCWGDSQQHNEWLYETTTQTCSFEDSIFLARDLRSGTLRYAHTYLESDQLNRFRFYGLYQNRFSSVRSSARYGNEEHVGSLSCVDDLVERDNLKLKVVFCIRGYKKLPGLYDSILRVATLDRNHAGLQSTVTLTGVSFRNARAFSQRFLQSIVADP
jgi:hypothetical protein